MSDDLRDAKQTAARELVEGPSLVDTVTSATELAGTQEWLARPPTPATGHGLEAWMRARFGLANP